MTRIAYPFLAATMALLIPGWAADEKPEKPEAPKDSEPAKAEPVKSDAPAPPTMRATTPVTAPTNPEAEKADAEKTDKTDATKAVPAKDSGKDVPQKAVPPPVGKEDAAATAEAAKLRAGGMEKPGAHGRRVIRLTLGKAIRFALAKNFSLRAEEFGPRIAKENVRSAWGKFDPLLDITVQHGSDTIRDQLNRNALTGEVQRFGVGTTAQDDAASVGVSGVTTWGMTYDISMVARRNHTGLVNSIPDIFTHEATLSLTQPLLRGAGTEVTMAGVRTARNNVLISQWALRDRIMTVITDVIVVYNDLNFTIENLKVALESRALAQQLLDDNIKKEKAGVMVALDVTTARSEVAAREEAVIQAERDMKDQENFLKQLITDDMIPLLGTDVAIEPPKTPGFYENVIAGVGEALELRPDYRQAKLNIENRKITVAVQKNALLPRLDLTASLSLLGISDEFGDSFARIAQNDQHNWSAGAVFSYPLGNRDARGRYNAATLEAAQALVQLQQLEQNIIVVVDNANGAVVTAKKRIDATTEASRLAKESLAAGEKRYAAGVTPLFEVLQLQKELTDAQTAELRARADYNQAIARYQQQIGKTLDVHKVTTGEEVQKAVSTTAAEKTGKGRKRK